MVKKGLWVKIECVLLQPEERTASIPIETKKVPYLFHINGKLLENSDFGKQATIESRIGRKFCGRLIEVNPTFKHDFGDCIQELIDINREVKTELMDCEPFDAE